MHYESLIKNTTKWTHTTVDFKLNKLIFKEQPAYNPWLTIQLFRLIARKLGFVKLLRKSGKVKKINK